MFKPLNLKEESTLTTWDYFDPVGPFQTRFHGQKALCVWGALVQIVQISWDLGQHLDVNNLKMIKEKKIRKNV